MGIIVSWFYTKPSTSVTSHSSISNASEPSICDSPAQPDNMSSVLSTSSPLQPSMINTSKSSTPDSPVNPSISVQNVASPTPMRVVVPLSPPPHAPPLEPPSPKRNFSPPIHLDLPRTSSSTTSPPSPPLPANHGLRIAIPSSDEPQREIAAYNMAADVPVDLCLDDDGLSALEKIYLFSRSSASFHRQVRAEATTCCRSNLADRTQGVHCTIPAVISA